MGNNNGVLVLRAENFNDVPDRPGVYAWYIDIRAWTPDAARQRPSAFSKDLNRKHQLVDPSTRIFLKSTEQFGTFWSAQVKISSLYTPVPVVNEDTSESAEQTPAYWNTEDDGTKVTPGQILDSQQSGDLAQFLFDSFPFFAAPIYIGTSKRLRTRLLQHKKAFNDIEQVAELYQEQLESGESWTRFAGRCHLQHIKLDDLILVCKEFSYSHDPIETDDQRAARYRGEQFLNLMSRPQFGMR